MKKPRERRFSTEILSNSKQLWKVVLHDLTLTVVGRQDCRAEIHVVIRTFRDNHFHGQPWGPKQATRRWKVKQAGCIYHHPSTRHRRHVWITKELFVLSLISMKLNSSSKFLAPVRNKAALHFGEFILTSNWQNEVSNIRRNSNWCKSFLLGKHGWRFYHTRET